MKNNGTWESSLEELSFDWWHCTIPSANENAKTILSPVKLLPVDVKWEGRLLLLNVC